MQRPGGFSKMSSYEKLVWLNRVLDSKERKGPGEVDGEPSWVASLRSCTGVRQWGGNRMTESSGRKLREREKDW